MTNLAQRKLARVLFDEFHSESWSVSAGRAREMQPEDPANASYQDAAEELARRDFSIARNPDLVSRYVKPNVASKWKADTRAIDDETDPKKWLALVHDDEFPLGNFHLNLQRRISTIL